MLAGRHVRHHVRRTSLLVGVSEHPPHVGGIRRILVDRPAKRRVLGARDDRVFFDGKAGETAINHCVVCAGPVQVWKGQHAPYLKVSCPECGDYGLTILGLAKIKNAAPEARARIRSALAEARQGAYRVDICMDESGGLGTRRGKMRDWSGAR